VKSVLYVVPKDAVQSHVRGIASSKDWPDTGIVYLYRYRYTSI
jgi:hypothetical protein